jgi:aryl-alcohol dehydrogenase-like predicted oxidoreductase
MEQRHLGRTGVPVSKLCLGAMMFGATATSLRSFAGATRPALRRDRDPTRDPPDRTRKRAPVSSAE